MTSKTWIVNVKVNTSGNIPTVPGEPKQSGGPVLAGYPYWVGERGPEMFVPNSSGRIVPNNRIGGDTIIINNYDEATAALTMAMMRRERINRLNRSM